MYNIKLSPTIPRPVPAESDRIVAAHYYGAWKKGAAGLHEGLTIWQRNTPTAPR